VRLKQRETLTVVESAITVDGLDPGVKAVEDTEELSEDDRWLFRRKRYRRL